jgi:hypothetical protein
VSKLDVSDYGLEQPYRPLMIDQDRASELNRQLRLACLRLAVDRHDSDPLRLAKDMYEWITEKK